MRHLHQQEEREGHLHQEEERERHLHQEEEREGTPLAPLVPAGGEGYLHQEEERPQEKGIFSCLGTWKVLKEHHSQSLQIDRRVLKFANL